MAQGVQIRGFPLHIVITLYMLYLYSCFIHGTYMYIMLTIIMQENYRMGGAYQWPGLSEVMQYRKTVRQLVTDLISSATPSLPVTMDHPWVRADMIFIVLHALESSRAVSSYLIIKHCHVVFLGIYTHIWTCICIYMCLMHASVVQ